MAYTPTTWTPGAFGTEITSARLNNIETGISNAHRGVGIVHTGGTSKADVIATLDAAEAIGKGTIAMFPAATYDVGTGLSLNGYSCQIRGQGAAMANSTTPAGTVFYASSQSGPVLDFKGWAAPAEFSGKVRHGDFAIRGSGVADATKANVGLRVDFCQSTTFADIAILDTGGPGVKLTADTAGYAVYLCDFERITIRQPVSAKVNDVPYWHSIEANGNRFLGIGFISRASSADCGVSGAAVIEGSSTYPTASNKLDAWWFENLHIPNGGCLVTLSGKANRLLGFQFFDCKKESGASNTYFYKVIPTAASGHNHGCNHIDGEIPGDNGGTSTDPDFGVYLNQPFNRIEGMKGYKGNNVVVASGVGHCYVHLKGSRSGASTAAIVDSSGQTTNHLIDDYNATEVRPAGWTGGGVGSPDVQVFTSGGTWTKPAGATLVTGVVIASGAGGGSGRRGAAGTVRCGGGGGGAGGITRFQLPASAITSPVTVSVGAGGAGGAAITADDTNGNSGSSGAASQFGSYARATGGTGGNGGTNATGSAGAGGFGTSAGAAGAAASTSGGVGVTSGGSGGPSGGASGGGITTGNTANNGGPGLGPMTVLSSAPAGGVVDSTSPGSATSASSGVPQPGGSGGGGAASITTAAQAGADAGLYGAGGSGGGASLNGNSSGAGGAGTGGIVIITTYF